MAGQVPFSYCSVVVVGQTPNKRPSNKPIPKDIADRAQETLKPMKSAVRAKVLGLIPTNIEIHPFNSREAHLESHGKNSNKLQILQETVKRSLSAINTTQLLFLRRS